MITSLEIIRALYGTWRVICWDKESPRFFDSSARGFWFSFFPAILIGPLHMIYASSVYLNMPQPPTIFFFAAINLLEYIILWLAYPLVVFYIAKLIKRENKFIIYIVMYNWSQLAVSLIIMPLQIALGFEILSSSTYLASYLLILGLYLAYIPFIARAALKINIRHSYAFVGVDILLTLFIGQIIFIILLV